MSKVIATGTAALAFAMSGASLAQNTLTPQQIAQRAKPATVLIRSLDLDGRAAGSGSGFFISRDGTIVTNFHVIEHAHALQVERDTGEIFDNVYFVAADPRRDTAILRIPAADTPALPLVSDKPAEIGSGVFVMGNPLGQTATFSDGMISARRVTNGVQLLQVTAPISPGSSGGPAMNDRGEVIGIATMFLEGGQNLNFLVPVDHVRPMLSMGDQPQRFTAAALPRSRGGLADIDTGGSGSPSSAQTPSEADSVIWEVVGSLTTQLAQVEAEFQQRGYWGSHEPTFGFLDSSEVEDTLVSLRSGRSYGVAAVCDNDCEDIDIALFAPNGERVQIDEDESDLAVISHVARASGDHTVRVLMYSCNAEPCGYGLKIYVKN